MMVRFNCLCLMALLLVSCKPAEHSDPLVVRMTGRSMSKLAFFIALDQGLYEKYGLEVEFATAEPEFEGARETHAPFWRRVKRKLGIEDYPTAEIHVTGHTPTMHRQVTDAQWGRWIAIATTDCSVRYYVVARPEIKSLEDIKGKRIGINRVGTTSAFAAFRLVERMGCDPNLDVSILGNGRQVADIEKDLVDVVVGSDEAYEEAMQLGYSILADTREWGD